MQEIDFDVQRIVGISALILALFSPWLGVSVVS